MPSRIASAACLKQEPRASLRLIDPSFDEARSCNILIFLADTVGLTKASGERLAVLAQLREHVLWLDICGIVVQYALQAGDVADGPEGVASNLSDALGDGSVIAKS